MALNLSEGMEVESTNTENTALENSTAPQIELENFLMEGRFEISEVLTPFREGMKMCKAYDHLRNRFIHLKIGMQENAKDLLCNELEVLSQLSGMTASRHGIPGTWYEGVDERGYVFHGFEPLGPSLRAYSSFFSSLKNRQIVVERIMTLGLALLTTIRDLHSMGYVHGYICPSTISCKRGDPKSARLTSFYYARKYPKSMAEARCISSPLLVGKTRTKFSSFAVQTGQIYEPRDDLESLGYVLVFLLRGSLPWYEISEEFTEDVMISPLDVATKMISLDFIDSELGGWMAVYLRYLRTLEHYSTPSYDFLENCLRRTLHSA